MSFGVSTLGPCAEAMGISVLMVFCVGVAQLPVTIGIAMHVAAVRIDLYTPYMVTSMDASTNATAVVLPNSAEGPIHASYMHGVNISGLFVLCASSFTFFVVLTMQFIERGLRGGRDSDDGGLLLAASFQEEFVAQNASLVADPSFRLWNQSFAASTLLMHAVAAATVCSPASTHMLVCICMLFLVSIGPMVHPMDNFDSGIAAASDSDSQLHRIGLASLVSQKVMGMGFIYLAAVGIVLTSILVDAYSAKAEFFLLLCFMDGFMLFGHLWDRVPTLQVIVNCRLLYITMLAAFNMGMLCMWKPYLQTPFVSGASP